MNLTPIGSNQTQVEHVNGFAFYSYQTPVVVTVKSTGEVFVTNDYYSRTTKKHIRKFLELLGNPSYKSVTQKHLEEVLK
jgi:hypothetical protein